VKAYTNPRAQTQGVVSGFREMGNSIRTAAGNIHIEYVYDRLLAGFLDRPMRNQFFVSWFFVVTKASVTQPDQFLSNPGMRFQPGTAHPSTT